MTIQLQEELSKPLFPLVLILSALTLILSCDRFEQFFEELFADKDLRRCADGLRFCQAVRTFMGDEEKSENHKLAEREFYTYVKMVRHLYDAFPMELRPYFKKKGLLSLVEPKKRVSA